MRIGFDMDDVICDANGALIAWANDRFGLTLTPDQDAWLSLTDDQQAGMKAMLDNGSIFRDFIPKPGAIDTLRDICDRHDVFIITAAMEHPGCLAPKLDWVTRHLPFFDPLKLVFCGDKSIAQVDYLVDDSPRHFERLGGTGVVFTAPKNRDETRYLRVNDWAGIRHLFLDGGL